MQSLMQFKAIEPQDASLVEALFVRVFAASEGPMEGARVGRLAEQLAACTAGEYVCGFAAVKRDQVIGAVFFSRLTFDAPLDAYILSPLAVDCDHQRAGVGRALIAHGLVELARRGVRLVVTYGDPAYYCKAGFRSISSDVIQPPHKLTQPHGWLGQPLTDEPLQAFAGQCSCVKALDDPAYW